MIKLSGEKTTQMGVEQLTGCYENDMKISVAIASYTNLFSIIMFYMKFVGGGVARLIWFYCLINLKTFVLSSMHIIEQDCDGYLIFKYANVYDGAVKKYNLLRCYWYGIRSLCARAGDGPCSLSAG
ncbi:hypothetical protein ACE1BS_21205 [Aeromonas jandaei]